MPFLQCPHCSGCSEMVLINRDGTINCLHCNKRYPEGDLGEATLSKPVATCKVCSTDVPFTPRNREVLTYDCSHCRNHVAVIFKNYVLRPQTVLQLDWNKDIETRAPEVGDGLHLAVCESKKDLLVAKVLQLRAIEEGHSFMMLQGGSDRVALVLLLSDRKYAGYLLWSEEDDTAVLRQMFLVEDERGKGYGTGLLRYWVESFADRINEEFGVESPNEITCKMLVKLGYLRAEKGKVIGAKCFFVAGM